MRKNLQLIREIGGGREGEKERERERERERVSWCFEPSQPQRLTSGLKRKRERERERELAGALSPANHKGL